MYINGFLYSFLLVWFISSDSNLVRLITYFILSQ